MASPVLEGVIARGVQALNDDRTAEALAILTECHDNSPISSDLNYLKAIALARLGEKNEAISILDSILSENPDHRFAYRLRNELGRDAKARADGVEGLRLFQILTFYPGYLEAFYARQPELARASYAEQLSALKADAFSAMHIFAAHLNPQHFDTQWTVANCYQLQLQWAREQGATIVDPTNWIYEITRKQIELFDPDVLYSNNAILFDDRFINSLARRPTLVAAWRAAPIDAGTSWKSFDLILSHLTPCRERAVQLGAAATEYFFPGSPAFIAEAVQEVPKQFDVVFTGQWTPDHASRNDLILAAAQHAERSARPYSLGFFIANASGTPLPESISRFDHGARWGLAMHQAIRSGKIVLNAEIDLARGEAGNMRLFEVTGTGSFLLTEYHENIRQFFEPGSEIETFRDKAEMCEKIEYYLQHEDEREAIAQRGQARCLRDHSMAKRMPQFEQMIRYYHHRNLTPGGGRRSDRTSLDTAKPASGEPASILVVQALELLKAGQVVKALHDLEDAARASSTVPEANYLRAACLSALGKHREALDAAHKELELNPQHMGASLLIQQLANSVRR